MFIAVVWRAPAIVLHPSGAVYMPDVRFAFENAFTWGVMVSFAYYLTIRTTVWWGLFFLIASFSAYYPINSGASEIAHHFVFYGCIWYLMCVRLLTKEKYKTWMLNAICCLGLIHIFLILGQGVFNYDPIMKGIAPLHDFDSSAWDRVPNVGLMSCVNGASAMLAICMPAFFRNKWFWLILLFVPAFIYSHTFTGPLAACIIGGAYLATKFKIKWSRVLIIGLAGITILTAYWVYVDNPDSGWRYQAWKSSLTGSKTLSQQWLGVGIGHWKLIYSRTDVGTHTLNQYFTQAHNELIQGQFEMGQLFSIILIGYLLNIIRRYQVKSIVPCSAVIAILITSSTFFIFHIALIAMVSIVWMAMLEKTLKLQPLSFCSVFFSRLAWFGQEKWS